MRKTAKHFDWKGRIETLEDRRVMSADPLLGGSIEHHAFVEDEAPQIEHQLVSEPDFWLDVDNLISLEDQLDQIEQTLYSAHNTTGLNSVVSNYGFTGIGQTVAVIDSGIAYDHFALGGGFGSNYKVVGGWDFTGENDANPYDDGPEGSHGTHVAGIVGGTSGSDKGVAPGVDLVALRVFDDAGAGYFSWVENALQWVINNRTAFENPITAINLSLGVSSWNSSSIPAWSTLEDEFATLKAAGVFIAVSAGNSFQSYNTPGLSYPAASPYVVPVMSVTDGGSLASYSQRDTRAIAAPGSSIRSTVPDYRGNNNGIADDYANFSGTSMASPYIAGASVLVRQAMEFAGYTGITQDTIYDHMMATATSFVDSATGLTFKRLNLGAAIDSLMPTDDYGSTVATAHNLGSLANAASLGGVISTLTDIDYFTFTASSNGSVTFEVSDTTHNMDAAWSLSNGTGTLSNNGDTFEFDVVAGQTYTVGLSSSGGLGYYSLDVSAESAFTYTDWGTVSFSQLNGLSVSGEQWYRVTAGQAGYVTVEGMYAAQNGQVSMQLYNSNMQSLATGNAVNGTCRVDAYATTGDQFYVRVLGTNSNVNYRLSNLVSVSGTTVNVAGTSGNDTFAFTAGNTHTVTVNGVTHTFNSVAVNAFNFSGGAGSDSIVMTGTAGNETATLRVGEATFVGAGYSANASGVENVSAYGGGGSDVVHLYDSSGNDVFLASPTSATLQGQGYQHTASGFGSIYAYASTGDDEARFEDSSGNDSYKAYPAWARIAGPGYYNYAGGFDRVYAFSTAGGIDEASLFDSTGNDSYKAYPLWARLAGAGYYNYAENFERVNSYATAGGTDTAELYDSAGNDFYRADPTWARMSGTDYSNYVASFDSVNAYATAGGNDTAEFYDSAGNDSYWAHPTWARMSGAGYNNYVSCFDSVQAYATAGGVDTAELYDSTGNDSLRAYPTWARLAGIGYYNYVSNFDSVLAYATAGADTAELYDSTGNDSLRAYPTWARLAGIGYYNYVSNFDSVLAYATAGVDSAELYDSTGNDSLRAYPTWARLAGASYYNYVSNFDSVHAYAMNGGYDTADLHDSGGNDSFRSYPTWSRLAGAGFYNYVGGFDLVRAHSSAGNDQADLYDSSGNDLAYVYFNQVDISGSGYFNSALGFKQAAIYASNGTDQAILDSVLGGDLLYGSGNMARISGLQRMQTVYNFDLVRAKVEQESTVDVSAVDYIFELVENAI